MTRPNDCAFPTANMQYFGLSVREYFAAMAMQGLVANSYDGVVNSMSFQEYSKEAVAHADALIAELNKETE